MRAIPILLISAALAGCAAAPPPPRSAKAEAEFQELIAGKVPGQPVSCLQHYRTEDMVRIDNATVLFKDGNRVYVNHLLGECSNLDSGFYALVTKSHGTGLCRGDIATVRDVHNGFVVGTCAMGDFIPYTKAS